MRNDKTEQNSKNSLSSVNKSIENLWKQYWSFDSSGSSRIFFPFEAKTFENHPTLQTDRQRLNRQVASLQTSFVTKFCIKNSLLLFWHCIHILTEAILTLCHRWASVRLLQVGTNGQSYTYWISRIYYSYKVQFKF